MSNEHTPGPWVVETDNRDLEAGGYWIVEESGIKTICGRGGWTNRVEESIANARLIAAAPDLLAGLRSLAAETAHVDSCDACRYYAQERGPACGVAVAIISRGIELRDAAIAKAEGR